MQGALEVQIRKMVEEVKEVNRKNEKEIRSAIKTDTTYGRKVLKCLERLRDRTGLNISQLVQESLIAYERLTREEGEGENLAAESVTKTDVLTKTSEEPQKVVAPAANNLLRLSGGDTVDY